jgi:hypothetical protein
MKTDYTKINELSDKKLRTLRNNLHNRLEALIKGTPKNLPPGHMLHGLDEAQCKDLLKKVQEEFKNRA